MEKIILASGSPRRKELLQLIVPNFQVTGSDVDETIPPLLSPWEAVEQLALKKAERVWQKHRQSLVIGGDTVVVLGDEILGKPQSRAQAREMLQKLSGNTHLVYTGMAVVTEGKTCVFHSKTAVEFTPISTEEIEQYIATGEPFDKAGGYGIQGGAAVFVKHICGNYLNIVGLDVVLLKEKLQTEFGFAAKAE